MLRNLWRGIAYAARYGKADPVAMTGGQWNTWRLRCFNKAVESLLLDEKDAMDRAANTDD